MPNGMTVTGTASGAGETGAAPDAVMVGLTVKSLTPPPMPSTRSADTLAPAPRSGSEQDSDDAALIEHVQFEAETETRVTPAGNAAVMRTPVAFVPSTVLPGSPPSEIPESVLSTLVLSEANPFPLLVALFPAVNRMVPLPPLYAGR